MSTIALGYGRKSVVRSRTDEVSVDKQRSAVERAARERGLDLEWYADAQGHRSGRFERTRPNYLRLVARLEQDPSVRAVIFYELDRAGRSVVIIDRIVKLCQSRGIALISLRDGIDTSRGIDANLTSQIQMRAVFSEYYANDVSDRMRSTAVYYRDELAIPWGMWPFGLQRIGEGKDARFAPNPQHGPTAVKALTWYASGLSYDAVSEKLNDALLHHVDRHGLPKRFSREVVRGIVGNILFYAGYTITGRRQHAKDSRIILEGEGTYLERYACAMHAVRSPAVEPLIDELLACSVIERRYKNQAAGRKPEGWVALLTPIAYWRDKKLRADTAPEGRFYHTRGSGPWINGDAIEAELIAHLAGLEIPPEMRDMIRRKVAERLGDTKRAEVQARIDRAKQQMETLTDLLLNNQIQRPTYNERYVALERALHTAQRELAQENDVDKVMSALTDLAGALGLMSAVNRKRAVARIFQRIEFDDEGKISRLVFAEWMRQAFDEVLDAWRTLNHANSAPGEYRAQRW